MRAGVTTHYLPRRDTPGRGSEEKGVDVWLALESYELAIYKQFDVLVLVAGDGDFVPLIRKLNTIGTRVMLLAWDHEWIDQRGYRRSIRTSQSLIDEVTYAVMMHDVIDDRSRRNDSSVNDLFIPPSPSAPVAPSFPANLPGSGYNNVVTAEPDVAYSEDTLKLGKITSLLDGYGFIEDMDGQSWFFHSSNLFDVKYEELMSGASVQFRLGRGPNGRTQAIDVQMGQ